MPDTSCGGIGDIANVIIRLDRIIPEVGANLVFALMVAINRI
jgi:hypothetical protein